MSVHLAAALSSDWLWLVLAHWLSAVYQLFHRIGKPFQQGNMLLVPVSFRIGPS